RVPAMLEAGKISARAAHSGFDWPTLGGVMEKLREEVGELESDLRTLPDGLDHRHGRGIAGAKEGASSRVDDNTLRRIEGEIGDLLFTVINVARYVSVDAESALRSTNRKFRKRFEFVEQRLRGAHRRVEDASLDEMEALWQQAKKEEA